MQLGFDFTQYLRRSPYTHQNLVKYAPGCLLEQATARNEASLTNIQSPLPQLLNYNNYTQPSPVASQVSTIPELPCYHCQKTKQSRMKCPECCRVVCLECTRRCGRCGRDLCTTHLNYDYSAEEECCSSCV